MSSSLKSSQGFTLLELITILVILGVLGASVTSRVMNQDLSQIQASRDLLVSAFFVAQQSAMQQNRLVQISTANNFIDIRVDSNDDQSFSASESARLAGTTYPIEVPGAVDLSTQQFVFNSLGHTSTGQVQLSKGGRSLSLNISGTGYVY